MTWIRFEEAYTDKSVLIDGQALEAIREGDQEGVMIVYTTGRAWTVKGTVNDFESSEAFP